MPAHKDLETIKKDIQNIGGEVDYHVEQGLPLNETPIPENVESKDSAGDPKQESTEDLLSDIRDDFEQGLDIEESVGTSSEQPTEASVDTGVPVGAVDDLEDLLGDMGGGPSSVEDIAEVPTEASVDAGAPVGAVDDLEDLLGDMGGGPSSVEDIAEVPMEEAVETGAPAGAVDDLEDLLGDMGGGPAPTEDIADAPVEEAVDAPSETLEVEGLEDFLGDMGGGSSPVEDIAEVPMEAAADASAETTDVEGLEDLLGDMGGGPAPTEDIADAPVEEAAVDGESNAMDGMDELLDEIVSMPGEGSDDLLEDAETKSQETVETSGTDEMEALLDEAVGEEENVLSSDGDVSGKIESSMDVDDDLAELAGEFGGADTAGGDIGEVEDVFDKIGQEESIETSPSVEQKEELESLLGSSIGEEMPMVDIGDVSDTSIGGGPALEESLGMDGIGEELSLDDVGAEASLDTGALETDLSQDITEEEGGIEGFDLDNLESFSADDIEKIPSMAAGELAAEPDEQEAVKVEDSTFGKVPIELSKEDIKKDKDVDLSFTDEERKQIVYTLTSFPKEAEIQISKAIVSGKYSNRQLKPLIDALFEKESPQVVIKYYENITGDRSLAHVKTLKYTGEKFEERKKTFAYIFQKNVLPILSVLATASVVLLGIVFLFIRLILPTWQASKYYKIGKANIEKKIFWEVEENFARAFNLQPRHGEVVEYARKYREYKRYLEAEKKYELAVNLKPDDLGISLEYADFFREIENYERSELKHRSLLKNNEKNVDVMLGLAKTYFDWSDKINDKIVDANEMYLDVLEIDPKNKGAVFGNLNIHLKQKDHENIMKHYDFIEREFRKDIDPIIYVELAEYLIGIGEVREVKNILGKSYTALKGSEYLPEIDYQYARYKKMLNVYGEEKEHLLNAIKQFNGMKKRQPERYGSEKYQKLLSQVYNDMGENFDRSEKASTTAEKYYLQAIQADPYNGKPYYNLANFAMKYKPDGYLEAKNNYIEAEQKGFSNDRLNFNLGWLLYRENDFYSSYKRINLISEKNPNNTNLKFMIGTIFYKLGKYDLSESILLETYDHFNNLSQQYSTLDVDIEDERMLIEMMKKVSNNLGATYQKKYEKTRKSNYLISATKYYSDSVNYFDLIDNVQSKYEELDANKEDKKDEFEKFKKENAHINLRMVLYPDAGFDEPIVYENFPLNYSDYM